MAAREVLVGTVGRPHGLRGEVYVEPRTDEPDRRFTPGTVLATRTPRDETPPGDRPARLTVRAARWHRSRLLLRFAELSDREAAEAVRGLLLAVTVDEDEAPEDPEEFYDHQLVGLAVVGRDGERLGELTRVVHGSAQDLLAVSVPDGREVLVPFVRALVPSVDLAAGHVLLDDRPGLLSADAEE